MLSPRSPHSPPSTNFFARFFHPPAGVFSLKSCKYVLTSLKWGPMVTISWIKSSKHMTSYWPDKQNSNHSIKSHCQKLVGQDSRAFESESIFDKKLKIYSTKMSKQTSMCSMPQPHLPPCNLTIHNVLALFLYYPTHQMQGARSITHWGLDRKLT